MNEINVARKIRMYSTIPCVVLPSLWVNKTKILKTATPINTGKLRKWWLSCCYDMGVVFVLLSERLKKPSCKEYKATLVETSGSVFLSLPHEWIKGNNLVTGDVVYIAYNHEMLSITKVKLEE